MPKHARTDNGEHPRFDEEAKEQKRREDPDDTGVSEAVPDDFQAEDGEYPDAFDSLAPDVDAEPLLFGPVGTQAAAASPDAGDAAHKKSKKHLTVQQKKSRRMRRVLIIVILLLIALIGALAYFSYQLFQETQREAAQQAIQQAPHDVDELMDSDTASDASTAVVKSTEAPLLVELLGRNQEEAIRLIGRGATAVSSLPESEEGNPVKMRVKVALTDEPGDTRSGTPTVYLGLDEGGVIVTAGYSAATSSLGYGTVSFSDAIKNESIIENTFAEAGLAIPVGSVTLPADKGLYSEFASDGTTLIKESFAFEGAVEQAGIAYGWSAVLTYDYTAANASGNLADTMRQVYVYVNWADQGITAPTDAAEEPAAEQPAA